MRVILNGEHAMNCNLSVAWIESRAFVNCLRHELCLTAHWLQFNSWSEARIHGEANSWCVSINSFEKTNRARIEGFVSFYSCSFLLVKFSLPRKWSCYAVKFVLRTSEVKFAHHFAIRRNFTHEVNFTIEDNFTCPKGKLSFSVFSVKDNTLTNRRFFIFS